MQFTTIALSALSVAGALAQSATSSAAASAGTGSSGMVKMHVVRVGGMNGSLTFAPNEVKAAVGDMVQFQFAPMNHSVVQSTFDAPCKPSGSIFSGYMPVKADAVNTPTYTIMVNDTKPLWLYCSQGKHCQNGMVMVINVAATGNKTLEAYKALAAKASASVSPSGGSGSNSTASTGGSSSSSSGSGSSGTSSGTSGSGTSGSGSAAGSSAAGGAAPTSTSTTAPQNSNAATIVSASASLGFFAIVAAFFL